MEARFATYEEAALFAAQRQSEGLFAKITQEMRIEAQGTESLDGYLVGFLNPADAESVEEGSPAERLLVGVIRFAVLAVLGVTAGWALLELVAYLFQGGIVPVLLLLGALACGFFALAGWSKFLSAVVHRSRGDGRSPLFPFAIAFIGAVLVGLTLWWW